MGLERNNYCGNLQHLQDDCKKYLYYHITLTMTDGSTLDGIIENVDSDSVTMLIGEDVLDRENENQFDQQRQYYGFGGPRKRFRRFRRRNFPLGTLATLALLPYIAPPPYPYYPYY